jgi:hypothetical protein
VPHREDVHHKRIVMEKSDILALLHEMPHAIDTDNIMDSLSPQQKLDAAKPAVRGDTLPHDAVVRRSSALILELWPERQEEELPCSKIELEPVTLKCIDAEDEIDPKTERV